MPPPEPRSSTVSPGRRSATAVGLPHPRLARTAASGSSSAASASYSSGPKAWPSSAQVEPEWQQSQAAPAPVATAELFKALADPARVRIVNLLATAGEPVCACNLNGPVGLAQPTVSHHLKKLVDAGLIEREQRGKWAYFSLRRDAVETLAAVADLKGVCC